MAPPTSHLRRPSHLRALELDHEPSTTTTSLFDAPDYHSDPLAASRDNPQPPARPQQLKSSQQLLPQDSTDADWDTRATILLAEVITVTLIVGTVLICCLRRHHRRLARQRIRAAQQMQEWSTIRIPAAGAGAGGRDVVVTAPTSPSHRGSISREDRLRQESGLSEMLSVLSASQHGRLRQERGGSSRRGTSNDGGQVVDEQAQANRTPLERLLGVPRTIGNIILYPLRALEAGVNGWATQNHDEVFLRQFMERLEAETEAARENPDDREIRLKEAFMKECMVWELGDEHFKPPKFDDEDFKENFKPSSSLFGGKGVDKDSNKDSEEVNYGLDIAEEKDELQDAEEGKMSDADVQEHPGEVHEIGLDTEESKVDGEQGPASEGYDCLGEEVVNAHLEESSEEKSDGAPNISSKDIATRMPTQNDGSAPDGDCNPTPGDRQETEYLPAPDTTRNRASIADEMLQMMVATSDVATIEEHPYSPTSELLGGTSAAGNLHTVAPSAAAMAEDTFDEDAAPGYLYLNTSGHTNRRRANTGGSTGTTSVSSSNVSTLSSVESMESMASMAASSTSQDSHKIPNHCAICLCNYEKGDTIVTSCNGDCPHAFHRECIVEWLVKMQDGTPCPCCRRTFVELDEHIPGSARNNGNDVAAAAANTTNNANANTTTTNNDTEQGDPEEAERLRRERRRRHIELGIRRGRAFNTSVISFRNNNTANDDPEAELIRQERERRNIELGLQRGGRAFNTSVISLR